MDRYILMADIIDSRKQSSRVLVPLFNELVLSLNTAHKKTLLSPLTITLGDEFQGIVFSLADALGLIFDAEELIIARGFDFKLRYVLHQGRIDTKLNRKIAYGMLGPGLTEAREKLNGMKKSEARFSISTNNLEQTEQLTNAFTVYQSLVDEWKGDDYPLIREFLQKKSYKEVSEIVEIDPSNGWRRERSLKIKPYFAIKEMTLSLAKTD